MNTETVTIETASAAAAVAPSRAARRLLALTALVAVPAAFHLIAPTVHRALNTVSTDDAYVNGHVTVVAPRVGGQVTRVLVDDNARVQQGDLLLELDREPYELAVEVQEAALAKSESALHVAEAQARATAAQLSSLRWKLEQAMENVDSGIAALHTKVSALESQRAVQARAQADRVRGRNLIPGSYISREEADHRDRTAEAAEADASAALQGVRQIRATLGLPVEPGTGVGLATVPDGLRYSHSSVRQALADLVQTAATLGLAPGAGRQDPVQVLEDLRELRGTQAHGTDDLVNNAPAVRDAQAAVQTARRQLETANLNLRYTQVRAETDGVITRRNVNPGNNLQGGQSVMAIRSTSEIWIDANFKETQLADLRIGQRVDLYLDMYGDNRVFEGRITGFTMGTGSTLALLPAQNASGNFVKVVQRLPVRIELTGPNPEATPLFIGLSVTPYVHLDEPASGPDAGKFLQPHRDLTHLATLAHAEVH